jgi:hypothetical protein
MKVFGIVRQYKDRSERSAPPGRADAPCPDSYIRCHQQETNMTSRHPQRRLDPASQLLAPSPAHALLGLFVGCILLAAATWLGTVLRGELPGIQPEARVLRLVDAERALIFDADAMTGDVRVLNVRSGVSEIARLHESHRQNVSAIALDAQRNILTVSSGDERYQYDTHSFRLLKHSPVLAAGSTRERDM